MNEEYRAQDFALTLRDPTVVAARLEVPHEVAYDARDYSLELLVPAIFTRV
jgi:hypothetical protein